MTDEQKQKMAEGRRNYLMRKAAEPKLPEEHLPVAANGHANLLDIGDPVKWQMKVRLHLESLAAPDADQWVEGIRLISTLAGRIARDQMHRFTTSRCFVCGKPFTDGRPAGESGYYDADRQYIKIYCHDQSEYNELLKAVMEKEDAIRLAAEKAEKAARQAATDARRAMARE